MEKGTNLKAVKNEKKGGFSLKVLITIIVIILIIAAAGIYYFYQKNLNAAKDVVQERAKVIYDSVKATVAADTVSEGVATGKRTINSTDKGDTFGGRVNSVSGVDVKYEAVVTLDQNKITKFKYEDFVEELTVTYTADKDTWDWEE